MMNAIVSFGLCTLSDEELIEKTDKLVDEMYKTRVIPSRHIPARPNDDFDLLIGEVLKRFYNITNKQLESMNENVKQTLGEKRVRTSFNASGLDTVIKIKQKSAELINLCEELKTSKTNTNNFEEQMKLGEFVRLVSLAQTAYEEAAMWAVKAATI